MALPFLLPFAPAIYLARISNYRRTFKPSRYVMDNQMAES
jgi:hypothetical protein